MGCTRAWTLSTSLFCFRFASQSSQFARETETARVHTGQRWWVGRLSNQESGDLQFRFSSATLPCGTLAKSRPLWAFPRLQGEERFLIHNSFQPKSFHLLFGLGVTDIPHHASCNPHSVTPTGAKPTRVPCTLLPPRAGSRTGDRGQGASGIQG